MSVAGPEPVHPGQCTQGSVQHPGPYNRPHHDAGHKGGGGRPVPVRQEDVGPRDPEALQVQFCYLMSARCTRQPDRL